MLRENMSREEEIKYVNKCFAEYEKEGFSKIFISPYKMDDGVDRQGFSFEVLGRLRASSETDYGEDTADLECLPLWKIKFEDGKIIAACPEEIIKSEIRKNLTRESDKKYLDLM